jgi:galactose mutarotase-like enzyme
MRIASPLAEVTLEPSHGMTITSISRIGEWQNILWERPDLQPRNLTRSLGPAGERSIESLHTNLLGGWFELSPHTGLPGEIDGKQTMLHGEAARLPWNIVASTPSSVEAQTRCVRYPLDLTRRICVEREAVVVESSIANTSNYSQQVAHGEHPCFSRNRFAGGAIKAGIRSARVLSALDSGHASLRSGEFEWPMAIGVGGQQVDVSRLPATSDRSHDHILLELAAPAITVHGADGLECTLQIDLEKHPYALYWRNFKALSAPSVGTWDVFALEPQSVPARSIGEALAANALTEVQPGLTISHRCVLTVAFSSGAANPLGAQRRDDLEAASRHENGTGASSAMASMT